MTSRLRSHRVSTAAVLLLLWGAASVVVSLWFSGRIRDWTVMTDEMQYVKLALSVAETGSPVPTIRGTTVSVANQLYPLLLAPLYGSLDSTDAFRAAHVLNAVVMTSAVVPAYLLARRLLDRLWAFGIAVLSVVTPWLVLTGVLMSEVVAYPVFLWAVLAFQRAIVDPGPRRDAVAAGALVVAILARTQFAAFALVLPLAILLHETATARADAPGRAARLRAGALAAVRRHRVLWALYAAGALVAVGLLLAGYRLLGAYTTTVEGGSPLPMATWLSALRHLDVVGIGCGLVPLLLGGGWLLATLTLPLTAERRAFATLAGLTIVALAVETASFDLRFGGAEVIRDRYLFYVVPLLLVASGAALTDERRRVVAGGVGAVTVAVAASAHGLPFTIFPGVSLDSPAAIVNDQLVEQSGALGTGTFVATATLLLGGILVLALVLAPPRPLALTLFAALLVFSAVALRAEVDRIVAGTSLAGRPLAGPPGVVLDWVDAVVPDGESAAMVPFPLSTAWGISAIQWWDVEFWNRTIARSYVAEDENFAYAPFPDRVLEVDPVTGVVAGTSAAPPYVIAAAGDPRFRLAGARHAANEGLVVLRVDRPYRAVWSTRGIRTDGWTRPGVPATVRLHPRPGRAPEVMRVVVRIVAPETAAARYRISTDTEDRPGALAAGAATDEIVLACLGSRPVDVTVAVSTTARVEGPPLQPEPGPSRLVGARVGPVQLEPTGRACDG